MRRVEFFREVLVRKGALRLNGVWRMRMYKRTTEYLQCLVQVKLNVNDVCGLS